MKSLTQRVNENFMNEANGSWYLMNDDEEKAFEYSTFDKDKIKKDLTDYLTKNTDDELWLYKVSNDTKTVGDDFIATYVFHKGHVRKEVQKGNKTFYKSIDESLNEEVDNMGIDLLTKDVEKAKKALANDFTIDDVRKLNSTQSAIELAEKPSRENYAKLKKVMGNIKWDHALPF